MNELYHKKKIANIFGKEATDWTSDYDDVFELQLGGTKKPSKPVGKKVSATKLQKGQRVLKIP